MNSQLKRLVPTTLKSSYRTLTRKLHDTSDFIRLKKRLVQSGSNPQTFDYHNFRCKVLAFLENHRKYDSSFEYYYSKSSTKTSLYASVYALMTLNILNKLSDIPNTTKTRWAQYFDSFQNDEGLFIDPSVYNCIYDNSDWWGARHLALHMISGYTALGARPSKPFNFLSSYSAENILSWIDSIAWNEEGLGYTDIDNKIMNVACLLQYKRDHWYDTNAAESIQALKSILLKKINPLTGMWGKFDSSDKNQRSRLVQFAYHIFPLFYYDDFYEFDWDRISRIVLKTQNKLGGFGVSYNSSACEDIDSIDILIRAYPFVGQLLKNQIDSALHAGFRWVTSNIVADGGFVFRLNEPFFYGSNQTMSYSNQGAMLPTWFRTLSLMYMARHLGTNSEFKLTKCPGYEQ